MEDEYTGIWYIIKIYRLSKKRHSKNRCDFASRNKTKIRADKTVRSRRGMYRFVYQ